MGEMNIALAGNPNVGKSTVFNALTGMNQHTGNWTGKTVDTARGKCTRGGKNIVLTDLPGTYSLMAHSAEEQVARDFICFGGSDGVIVVCDASCLERNLNLVLQVMEITPKVLVCVNLLDEAAKKKIKVSLDELEKLLGVPVCGVIARNDSGLDEMLGRLDEINGIRSVYRVDYGETVERAVGILSEALETLIGGKLSSRFAALRILEHCEDLTDTIDSNTCGELKNALSDSTSPIGKAYRQANDILVSGGMDAAALRDKAVTQIVIAAEKIAAGSVTKERPDYYERDRKIDSILTHRFWGLPLMLGLLAVIFYITLRGANYPSAWLSAAFTSLGEKMRAGLVSAGAPDKLISMLIDGVYLVLTWVVSVMLPPMAIFFPMFTLLEDVGYLPRAAFNLDKYFARANACGKQALTMSMGLGCNAAGITGCRIIDSRRERLIAIITNNFMPCNGRFPALIAMITIFFSAGSGSGLTGALMLTGMILLGAVLTFAASRILSSTLLKGEATSFALELPPYRRPQIGKVLIRSIFDRTIFVLGRAVTAAAPAGLILWLAAEIKIGDMNILSRCAEFLDPIGGLFGLDGVILIAFIMGFPANEIVLPIMLMIYMGETTLADAGDLTVMGEVFRANGWSWVTALCTMVFILCHFPCATSCLTIKKETGSWKWTAVSMLLPTVTGLVICAVINAVGSLFV